MKAGNQLQCFWGAGRGAETQQKHQSRAGRLWKGVGRVIQLASSRGLPGGMSAEVGDGADEV